MTNTPVISKEAEVLLKLLRIILGTEPLDSEGKPLEPIPADIDWKELKRISGKHKVSALAADALDAIGCHSLMEDSRKEIEDTYAYYFIVLSTLCQVFISNDLTPIILKGYGLSLNYPVPAHRGAGDIDIFLVDKDGRPAAEKGVEIVENLLKVKTVKVPHDYEFDFKGVTVELHYEATNAYWDHQSEQYIVDRLTELLPLGCIPCPGIQGAMLPSATFNAVYLMRHMFGHFFTVSTTIRQYIDWALFLQHYSNEVDWPTVAVEWQKAGMKPFADGLGTMLQNRLGLAPRLCPICVPETRTEQFALRDTMHPIPYGRHLHQRIRYFFGNRDKLAFLTGRTWLSLLEESVRKSVRNLVK